MFANNYHYKFDQENKVVTLKPTGKSKMKIFVTFTLLIGALTSVLVYFDWKRNEVELNQNAVTER